jgi:hypothetical protein
MIDFEDRLRSELRAAAEQRPDHGGLERRVDERISRHQRRARARRSAAVVGCVLVVVVALVALTRVPGDGGVPGETSLANATPRDGSPGWAQLAEAPIPRPFAQIGLNLDGEVLVFGGTQNEKTGHAVAIYDPAHGRWRRVADSPGEMGGVAVWTGDLVLALGTDGRLFSYDPVADDWSERARSPFSGSTTSITSAAWTGATMLTAQSSQGNDGRPEPEAASYDPATDTWTSYEGDPVGLGAFSESVWSGTELFVRDEVQGAGGTLLRPTIRTFTPSHGWGELPAPPLEEADHRTLGYSVWTGTELIVGGGVTWDDDFAELVTELSASPRDLTADEQELYEGTPASDAAAWNPQTQTWRTLPDAPVPTDGLPRYPEVWTGQEIIVWESDGGFLTGRLALLDPETGAWRVSEAAPHGSPVEAPAIWTGREMIVVAATVLTDSTQSPPAFSQMDLALSFTP